MARHLERVKSFNEIRSLHGVIWCTLVQSRMICVVDCNT